MDNIVIIEVIDPAAVDVLGGLITLPVASRTVWLGEDNIGTDLDIFRSGELFIQCQNPPYLEVGLKEFDTSLNPTKVVWSDDGRNDC